ncbi:hypothetical protein ACFL6U_01160 [Planctomycetota bacterium]
MNLKRHVKHNKFMYGFFLPYLLAGVVSAVELLPTGTGDDYATIQNALDNMKAGDAILLNGDFKFGRTLYLPSNITWILNGTMTLANNAVLDKVGVVEPGVDSRRSTGITEIPGGATNIKMFGGTYEGNAENNSKQKVRLINFTHVTHSKFQDMIIQNVSDDNFTIGAKSTFNECRNLLGKAAGGNALTDKGDYNKWYDCVAEDCLSDGWTPKCRNSEFYRCVGRRNLGPGFGCFARLDGSNPDQGEIITGNKFYACESYDNERGGFSFNIAGTSGPGSIIRDNFIQGVFYNNKRQGVTFRNKQPDGIIENNAVDIIAYGNQGQKNDGTLSSYAGGLGIEGSPITGLTGSFIGYDNAGYDLNVKSATFCTLTVYIPNGGSEPIVAGGDISNSIDRVMFSCPSAWCIQNYCEME